MRDSFPSHGTHIPTLLPSVVTKISTLLDQLLSNVGPVRLIIARKFITPLGNPINTQKRSEQSITTQHVDEVCMDSPVRGTGLLRPD